MYLQETDDLYANDQEMVSYIAPWYIALVCVLLLLRDTFTMAILILKNTKLGLSYSFRDLSIFLMVESTAACRWTW